MPPFFTVGHSGRSIERFLALLREADIGVVADVRKLPGSRAHPQFDAEPLREALSQVQIGYDHIAELGGRRGKALATPDGLNGLWSNRSFHNYADHALTEPFRAGLRRLLAEGHRRRCAIMCAEAVWWRCHRRIVADYLLARGEAVFHIMGEGRIEAAKLTAGAVVQADGAIHYPAIAQESRPKSAQ